MSVFGCEARPAPIILITHLSLFKQIVQLNLLFVHISSHLELFKHISNISFKLFSSITPIVGSSSRTRISMIRTINKTIQEGETAVIPGKVLSDGELTVKKAIVAAYQFSDTAKEKINKTGKAINLTQLMKDNPKAQNVRIFG